MEVGNSMLNIRQAKMTDVDDVISLVYLAIKDIAYQLTGEQHYEDVIAQLKKFYLSENNRFSANLVTVKTVDEKVAGMILCYDGLEAEQLYSPIIKHLHDVKLLSEATIDDEADEDEYYIDALAVFPEYQGHGIAKELFAEAEKNGKLKGFKKISLNVDLDNEKAEQLYTRLGYRSTKQITINGRPYWHMVKPL